MFLLRLFDGPGEKQQYMDALSTTFKAWSNEVWLPGACLACVSWTYSESSASEDGVVVAAHT